MKRTVVMLMTVVALGVSIEAVTPASAGPAPWKSVGARVWSRKLSAFVNVPPIAMPLPSKQTWRLTTRADKDVLNEGDSISANGIFLTPNGKELTRLDPASGKPKWNMKLSPLKGLPSKSTVPVISTVRAKSITIVAVDRSLAAKATNGDELQVDVVDAATGRLLWTRTAPDRSDAVLLVDDLLWLQSGGGVEAIDAKTGVTAWENRTVSSCDPYAGFLLCSAGSPTKVALVDAKSGKLLWVTDVADNQQPDDQSFDELSRSMVDGMVYLRKEAKNVVALDRTSGRQMWISKLDLETVFEIRPLDSTHVLAVGLTPKRKNNGVLRLYSVALADGKNSLLFEGKSEVRSNQAGPDDDKVLVINNQTYIFVRSQDGTTQQLDQTGKVVTTANERCDLQSSVEGDVLLCHVGDEMKFLSLPGLQLQSTVKGIPEFTTGVRIDGAWVASSLRSVSGLGR
jgi:outer membrane protein assembly factor BamB